MHAISEWYSKIVKLCRDISPEPSLTLEEKMTKICVLSKTNAKECKDYGIETDTRQKTIIEDKTTENICTHVCH